MEPVSTTFTEKDLESINKTLSYALDSARFDFYTRKYGKQTKTPITSFSDFTTLPTLKKEEFANDRSMLRSLSQEESVSYFGISSGTTSGSLPTIVPHGSFFEETFRLGTFNGEEYKLTASDRLLVLWSPTSAKFQWLMNWPQKPCPVIAGDPKNLELSAKIAQEAGVTSVMTTATGLYFLIQEFEKNGFDLKNIRWVNFGGEFCTEEKLRFFKDKLASAVFNQSYGISEFGGGGVGYRCKELARKNLNIFHPMPGVLMEVLNDDGSAVEWGEIGRLVLTPLTPRIFPLIRYETSDFASLSKEECACGNELIFHLNGRADFEILKFNGIVLRSEMIEESLKELRLIIEPNFQMHVHEEKNGDSIKPRLELHLSLRNPDSETPEMKNMIRESVSSLLRISPTASLTDLVQKGIFMPLDIVIEKNWGDPQFKSRHIVSHLS